MKTFQIISINPDQKFACASGQLTINNTDCFMFDNSIMPWIEAQTSAGYEVVLMMSGGDYWAS